MFTWLLTVAAVCSLVGCKSLPESTDTNPWVATTLELTGTESAPFTGYYVARGQKAPVSGLLPKTITDFGVTECEFLKRNSQDTLWLKARDGSSVLNFAAHPGTKGVKARLSAGWSARAIRK